MVRLTAATMPFAMQSAAMNSAACRCTPAGQALPAATGDNSAGCTAPSFLVRRCGTRFCA